MSDSRQGTFADGPTQRTAEGHEKKTRAFWQARGGGAAPWREDKRGLPHVLSNMGTRELSKGDTEVPLLELGLGGGGWGELGPWGRRGGCPKGKSKDEPFQKAILRQRLQAREWGPNSFPRLLNLSRTPRAWGSHCQDKGILLDAEGSRGFIKNLLEASYQPSRVEVSVPISQMGTLRARVSEVPKQVPTHLCAPLSGETPACWGSTPSPMKAASGAPAHLLNADDPASEESSRPASHTHLLIC